MMLSAHSLISLLLVICASFNSLAIMETWKAMPCDVTRNDTIIYFDCNNRHLSEVPDATQFIRKYVYLNLSNNQIQNISKVSFQGWTNLVELNLNWNRHNNGNYTNMCEKGMSISKGTFSNLDKLTGLSADGLHLCRIPVGMPASLSVLSLQFNHIFYISKQTLSEIIHLNVLYLQNNCYYSNPCGQAFKVTKDAFEDFLNLTILSLSSNNLTDVPLSLPPSLKELYLSNNQIHTVNEHVFQKLHNLEILHLSGNCPRCFNSAYPCQECPGGTALNIHENAFQNLINLIELNLGSTSLQHIPAAWFEGTPHLKKLNLELNYLIQEIATGDFFLKLPNLQVLDLSFNYNKWTYVKFLNLSVNFSKLTSLQELHLKGYVFQQVLAKHLSPIEGLPNLNILNLAINFIQKIDLAVFKRFSNLSLIYLSENGISPLSKEKEKYGITIHGHRIKRTFVFKILEQFPNMPHSNLVTSDGTHTQYPPLIKPKCSRYGKTLDLSLNSLFYINPEQFKDFDDIACLNLSNNGIGQYLNGSEFVHLTNLTYLDLSHNKVDLASSYAFNEIKRLEVLDLSYNEHYFIVEGVIHTLGFLENLLYLKVLNLSSNQIYTLTENVLKSNSLKELVFKGNRLDKLWKAGDHRFWKCFESLSNLTYLDLSFNKLKEISNVTYYSLPKGLVELYLNHNELGYFPWIVLRRFQSLKKLDLSFNKLTMLSSNLNKVTDSLQMLLITHNKITELSNGFLAQANSLTYLDLSNNKLQVINQSAIQNPSGLKILVLKGNPFDCTCETSGFMMWMRSNNLSIPRLATDVICSTPINKRGDKVISFDTHTCNLDQIAMTLFLLSFLVIVNTTIISLLKHLFYWDVWYIYFFCLAKLKGYRTILTSKCMYDAFISYDTKDTDASDWVLNELSFHLEGNGDKQVLLCLEERDWEPGKAVIDNLVQSIHQSRKTIFVLTKRYAKSGCFKTAFYIAMQRLMDESMDVIVLILLQPVLQHSQYLRLRRRICKSSILEWPKNPSAEGLFWQRLKNVLRTENYGRYDRFFTDPIISQYKDLGGNHRILISKNNERLSQNNPGLLINEQRVV